MVETVLAVLFVSLLFLALFRLSCMLTSKVMLQHAAMRVARARSVGFNDYMCRKSARVAVIPVAGRRTWPAEGEIDAAMEEARVSAYMATADEAEARGVLDYERWGALRVDPGDGRSSDVSMDFEMFDGEWKLGLSGEAGVESNHLLYMNDAGR